MVRLNKKRKFGTVFGDEADNPERPRKFMQDGRYFDAKGYPIDEPPPKESILAQIVPKSTLGDEPGNEPDRTEDDDSVVVVERKEEGNAEIILQLKDKSIFELKAMAIRVNKATEAALPVMQGKGVKARLVAYIAEHAE